MNVVLFVADSLRADHLSCYGYERETTPFLDGFADANVRYDTAYTPATWTRAAATSLLTGTYPSVHGVTTMQDRCDVTIPRAPELFSAEGYTTSCVSAIGNVSSELGFQRGFDTFVDLYRDDEIDTDRPTSTADAELLEQESGEIIFPEGEHVVDRFQELLLDGSIYEPFFSLLWTIDTHDPFRPPAGYETYLDAGYEGPIDGKRESLRKASTTEDFRRLRNLYDSEVRYVDDVFRSLIETLQSHEVFEDTLIVFVADHGEALGDHGANVGHGHVPYEELLRVPLVVRYPDGPPPWTGDEEFVSLIDLLPTVIDYVDVEGPDVVGQPYAGRSVLEGGRDVVFSETEHSDVQNAYYSIRRGDWKYIRVVSPDGGISSYLDLLLDPGFVRQFVTNPLYFLARRFGDRSEYLYDLAVDPGETDNRIDEPGLADGLRDELRTWREGLDSVASSGEDGGKDGDLSEDTRQQLREMGYL